MGKVILNGLNKITGTHYGIVFYEKMGQPYCRMKQGYSDDQKKQERYDFPTALSACSKLADKVLLPPLNTIWNNANSEKNGRQLFKSINKSAFDLSGEIDDYAQLKLSVGCIPLPESITINRKYDDKGTVMVTWSKELKENASASDRLHMYMLIEDEVALLMEFKVNREATKTTFKLMTRGGQDAHLYLFFVNKGYTHGSDSHYHLLTY
jgi:hypothetical protein